MDNILINKNNDDDLDQLKKFFLSFTWQDQTVAIQLVNDGDVLKLADIFSKMLTDNNIEHNIIK
jgi:hypothetical protein